MGFILRSSQSEAGVFGLSSPTRSGRSSTINSSKIPHFKSFVNPPITFKKKEPVSITLKTGVWREFIITLLSQQEIATTCDTTQEMTYKRPKNNIDRSRS